MYSIETTTDGKIFRPLFIDGRLRIYTNLSNAKNGARQLLKNPKNHYSMVRIINKDNIKEFAVYVRKTDTGYYEDIWDRNKPEQAFKPHNSDALLPENLSTPIDIKVEKKIDVVKTKSVKADKVEKKEEVKKDIKTEPKVEKNVETKPEVKPINKVEVKNKIPLETLAENPKTNLAKVSVSDKEKRIQSLKEAHDKWKMKKANPPEIKKGDSLNNLSDNHSVKQVNDIYASLMGNLIDDAISQNNAGKLFKLEVMLSQGGYSWYYKDNSIHVDTTENVIQKLKDLELVLDD